MGRATVVSNLGSGQYRIEIDAGEERINARINKLTEIIEQEQQIKAEAEAEAAGIEEDIAAIVAELNAMIAVTVYIVPDTEAILAKHKEGSQKGEELAKVKARLASIEFRLTAAATQLARIEAVRPKYQKTVWCATHTTNATGEVATIEVPGEPDWIVMAPAGRKPTVADGFLLNRTAMSPEQAFFNYAILPGWQRFTPTYRFGTIYDIDKTTNTCSVMLWPAASSAQRLPVNKKSVFTSVPVVYLTCHAKAFKPEDSVLVEFQGQDWENPRVVGFQHTPRRCPLTVTYAVAPGLMIGIGEAVQHVVHGESTTPVLVSAVDTLTIFTQWSDGRTERERIDEDVQESFTVTAQAARFPDYIYVTPGASATRYPAPGDWSLPAGETFSITPLHVSSDGGYAGEETTIFGPTCETNTFSTTEEDFFVSRGRWWPSPGLGGEFVMVIDGEIHPRDGASLGWTDTHFPEGSPGNSENYKILGADPRWQYVKVESVWVSSFPCPGGDRPQRQGTKIKIFDDNYQRYWDGAVLPESVEILHTGTGDRRSYYRAEVGEIGAQKNEQRFRPLFVFDPGTP